SQTRGKVSPVFRRRSSRSSQNKRNIVQKHPLIAGAALCLAAAAFGSSIGLLTNQKENPSPDDSPLSIEGNELTIPPPHRVKENQYIFQAKEFENVLNNFHKENPGLVVEKV